MKGFYSQEEIESAAIIVEKKGLGDFMNQNPREKKQIINHDYHRLSGHNIRETYVEKIHSNHFFDVLMFGTPSYQSSSDSITETRKTHDYDSQTKGTLGELDSEEDCDPCEQVREIVQGIRDGKYRLKTSVLEEEFTNRSDRKKGLRKPHQWTKNKRLKRAHDTKETFQYYKQYWDGGNMRALRMKK